MKPSEAVLQTHLDAVTRHWVMGLVDQPHAVIEDVMRLVVKHGYDTPRLLQLYAQTIDQVGDLDDIHYNLRRS